MIYALQWTIERIWDRERECEREWEKRRDGINCKLDDDEVLDDGSGKDGGNDDVDEDNGAVNDVEYDGVSDYDDTYIFCCTLSHCCPFFPLALSLSLSSLTDHFKTHSFYGILSIESSCSGKYWVKFNIGTWI